ncbi:MAG TPA: cytochrome d ubiquinol oxidase subunit II [Candidatus Angelobacter sp.]|nr:cytochrome d ubiquinol oxidase subunit II [Candidatus Angelobacter sp.]
MQLSDVPAIVILLGLAAYMALAGADFGTGVWELTAPRTARGMVMRDDIHDAMGPVWEANHVWLILLLVVCWTAYPTAFASIFSTLSIPFFFAVVGIILRGSSYALRAAAITRREQGVIDSVFSLSSILTPFFLGAAIGGIASGRVPVGNAAGDLLTSWVNPTSLVVGAIAVAAAAHLAAVYLAADAAHAGRVGLMKAFRDRALVSGVAAGALAIGGLFVVHGDAPQLFSGLTGGAGLVAVVISAVSGLVTLVLVLDGCYQPARVAGALAVAAVIAGWAAAQQPYILPGLTIHAAASSRNVLIAVLLSAGIGALVLVPSLALLFSLKLRGAFERVIPHERIVPARASHAQRRRSATLLLLLLAGGAVLTVFAGADWALGLGIGLLLLFVAGGFVLLARDVAGSPSD